MNFEIRTPTLTIFSCRDEGFARDMFARLAPYYEVLTLVRAGPNGYNDEELASYVAEPPVDEVTLMESR